MPPRSSPAILRAAASSFVRSIILCTIRCPFPTYPIKVDRSWSTSGLHSRHDTPRQIAGTTSARDSEGAPGAPEEPVGAKRAPDEPPGHDYPIVAHPIVRVHRETGVKILWVNVTQRLSIIGLDRAESRELLTLVIDQYRKPENQVRFSWRPGSIAFWDNRAAVHYAVRNYADSPRLLELIMIADEPLYADL
ncbi:TauD/TfdA family dioxygenase [Frankia sp. Cas4]|uniref:TauD/TfdA dioxygenase family protein n=1 Tax=Frankia sp. Cas4 TaxID=3073927 RepID=UPI002AD1D61A|nr:TauD/TfdA family dioxygenase [Frankia sp. Cas4]